ncbi:UvrD-helicase domain-containing protein [Paenibacillus pseudetheri]|uniref:ATP-dependent DNA helicase Rep n=1 Tax=Paenibacillus pseudetheri TaxID=2897682 RepID=A0ABM9BI57_9BACL|nr:UvrD-helicase domain-containing protein [Paenibacillus pseudetheri]CAH1058771.1 ATP-dependent DNA helicase Rep [Paenibacillus pseudetheri]
MFTINDDDIELSERLLLPDGQTFDEERRNVIRCMDAVDIQACPGSGKTTTLLAKLSILARQLPLKTNQGICVLTHTNVAVDEISKRLDGKADVLLRYPNHFGTIQSFVNKFLAIPAYIDIFGKRPARIDDEIFHEYINRRMRSLDRGTQTWLSSNGINLADLRFNLQRLEISKKIDGPIIMRPETKTYPKLKDFKVGIMREGMLCYDDAYSLAYWYVRQYPGIKEVFSERFSYVFIDEMQDTDAKQKGILDQVFDPSKVVVQKIGDSNQAIYDSAWQVATESLNISGSMRFSNVIANTVKNICLNPQVLKGNPSVPDISPKIIVFDDESISKVIPKFGELIFDNNLHMLNRKVYKAIGKVGRPNVKRTLPAYFEPYGKIDNHKNQDFESLSGYVRMASGNQNGDSVASLRLYVIRSILKSLRLLGVRRSNQVAYTETTFMEYLKNEQKNFSEEFNLKLTEWCFQLYGGEDITDELKQFIRNNLCAFFAVTVNAELESFLDDIADTESRVENQKANIYIHERGTNKVAIDIATVHSVKGETHTATLFLETYYRMFDVESIIEYMKGNHKPPKNITTEDSLNVAYVGMTRATHMLCVAAHKDGCNKHLDKLAEAGWEIHNIY